MGRQYHGDPSVVHTLDARAVARALGGAVVGRNKVAAPGPGHSKRDRSLSVMIDPGAPDGFVVFSHAGDGWETCKDYVRAQLGLPTWQPGDECDRRVEASRCKDFDRAAVNAESAIRERTADERERIARAVAIWDEAADPRGTAAEAYLAARALVLADDVAGTVLRFHPRTPWRNEDTGTTGFIPCMLAAFRSVDDDVVTGVHRIRLDRKERWPKAERRMLGIVHRAAVKLAPAGDALHVGEGVETALAASALGHTPAWALGSAGAISHFPVIGNVTTLRLLGERCTANADAAEHVARRWHGAGRTVQIGLPDDPQDKDFNDQLIRQAV